MLLKQQVFKFFHVALFSLVLTISGNTPNAFASNEDVNDNDDYELKELTVGDKFKIKLGGVAGAGDDGFFTGIPFSTTYSHTLETFGGMKGSIKGAHKLKGLLLHSPDLEFPIVRGKIQLASPNYVLGANSKYTLIAEGILESCCSENFKMKGTFNTCMATGRFSGTMLVGTWEATGDFGYDNNIILKGEVVADNGNGGSCSLTDVYN